jgi:hypothetical protein
MRHQPEDDAARASIALFQGILYQFPQRRDAADAPAGDYREYSDAAIRGRCRC